VSLREGCIEAIAVNAIAPPPPVHQEDMEIARQIASDALDAILDYLEANADGWQPSIVVGEPRHSITVGTQTVVRALIAALRQETG
jgi:hypothetical protein